MNTTVPMTQAVDSLKEVDLLAWQGLTHKYIRAQFAEEYRCWKQRPHQFQMLPQASRSAQVIVLAVASPVKQYFPILDLYKQAQQFWQENLPRQAAKTVLVVAHAGTHRALISTAIDGWKPRFPSEITTRTCSRALPEWSLRQRLTNYPHVRFLEACNVTNLLADANKIRVIGVRVRSDNPSQQELGSEVELLASLVVDASGRNSQASNWLKTLGYPSPNETVVNSFLGYASRCYHHPKDFQSNWKVLMQQGTPPTSSRGAILLPIEGGRWILTLAGAARDYPPADEAAFLDFARSLPSPIL